jgi:hypothetical protein
MTGEVVSSEECCLLTAEWLLVLLWTWARVSVSCRNLVWIGLRRFNYQINSSTHFHEYKCIVTWWWYNLTREVISCFAVPVNNSWQLVCAATDKHTTREELLEAVFSTESDPSLYSEHELSHPSSKRRPHFETRRKESIFSSWISRRLKPGIAVLVKISSNLTDQPPN